MAMRRELVILVVDSARAWDTWLARWHTVSNGVWLRVTRKDVRRSSVTYAQALDVALSYGWTDIRTRQGQVDSWLQRFGPRHPGSAWSRLHAQRAERLIRAGRMRPAGLRAITAARASGRWRIVAS
jgi:uncharacterized protein YdeI (YjbR/CyaY-like superfamily)